MGGTLAQKNHHHHHHPPQSGEITAKHLPRAMSTKTAQLVAMPEQATSSGDLSSSSASKLDEKTESTAASPVPVAAPGVGGAPAATSLPTKSATCPPSPPEKRKRGDPPVSRRFSRFFRASSPTKKQSYSPKKARMERRRSTGSSEPAIRNDNRATTSPTHKSGTTRSRMFLRRNVSMGSEPVVVPPPPPRDYLPTTASSSDDQQQSQQHSNKSSTIPRQRRRSLLFRRNRTALPKKSATDSAAAPLESTEWQDQTHIIAVRSKSPRSKDVQHEEEEKKQEDAQDAHPAPLDSFFCQTTEIFQHSYLETLCGVHGGDMEDDVSVHDDDEYEEEGDLSLNRRRRTHRRDHDLPDDPTVQESIECVFSNRLEEDIARMLQLDDDGDEEDEIMLDQPLVPLAPSQFQQSVLRTRSDLDLASPPLGARPRKRVESVKLAHIGSLRPGMSTDVDSPIAQSTSAVPVPITNDASPIHAAKPPACTCRCRQTPQLDPSAWPQAPLLLRPTPGSGTRVKCIRLVGGLNTADDHGVILWQAGQASRETWTQALHKYWGTTTGDSSSPGATSQPLMCPECMVLPINNGNELNGETLVTDFESDLFEGTLLIRLRYSNGTTKVPYRDDRGYFTGMNRRYQTVIRGRFKQPMSWTDCRTGLVLDRPAGRLPAKWILKGGIKVLSFFAPHLEVKFDGPRPTSLTPLGSTPQVLAVHKPEEPYDMEAVQEEPTMREHCLLGEASAASSSLQRARFRKKAFDKLYAHRSVQPKTDPSKVYTFEFLQHLFNFQDFNIELGSMLGSIPLAPILDGQALPIMACHASLDRRLWSFDVWHESLIVSNQAK